MHGQVQKQAPSETTEARSDKDRKVVEFVLRQEVAEFLQRDVDPGLLTSSRSSGPPGRRARPGKVDKTKKVPFMSVISCDWAQHNTCTCAAGVQSSSSSAAEDLSRWPSSSSTCLQPAGGQDREAEARAGQDLILEQVRT